MMVCQCYYYFASLKGGKNIFDTQMNSQTRAAKESGSGAGPQRGSFPLDHLHECDHTIEQYFLCMKKSKQNAQKCRIESRAYLDCRLEKNLMTKEDYRSANLPDVNEPVEEFDVEQIKQQKRLARRQTKVAGVGRSGINWDQSNVGSTGFSSGGNNK
jgi:cytochrome c oxidase assembly protein subunit 19